MTDQNALPIVYNPDGTTVCQIDGKAVTLRRPKFGEFRDLREAGHRMNDEIAAAEKVMRATVDGLPDDDTAGANEAARTFTDYAESERVAWALDMISRLSGIEITESSAEVWMSRPEFIAALLAHWRTVPLPSGVPGR